MTHPFLSFELPDDFVNAFKQADQLVNPFPTALGEATFFRTYSRSDNPRLPEGVMESWSDVCRRVIEGMHSFEKDHCLDRKINWNQEKAEAAAQEAFIQMHSFKWTPPGRGIQFMGTPLVHVDKVVEALQNCAFISTQDIARTHGESFQWLMSMSMLGVGVGFDVRGAGSFVVPGPNKNFEPLRFLIPDTREGWALSVKLLVDSYFKGDHDVVMDYSLIRPAGMAIKRFGGTASGPAALQYCHRDIRAVLNRNVGTALTSTTITDIMNIIGVAVVAGNTRRSAEIALGYPGDEDFVNLKTPEQQEKRPWFWLSNNSVFAEPGMDYSHLAELTYSNGEPGYFWLNNVRNYARMNKVVDQSDYRVMGGNPCLEQELEPFEMCTLSEMYLPNIQPNERRLVVKHAYRYAKIVTLASQNITHNQSREVMQRNRRIGLSQTGVAQFYDAYGEHALISALSEMYDYVQRYDALYSQWYAVPRSIRTTSVKPSGTVSLLANVTPGAHFSVAGTYYLRRVNMKAGSPLAIMLAEHGYPVEPSVYSQDTWVVSFPEKMPHPVRSEAEVDVWEQLKLAQILARYWSDNMVSITLKFDKDRHSVKDVEDVIKACESTLKGVSLLPLDKNSYAQMPYEALTEDEYLGMIKRINPFHLIGEVRGLHDSVDAFCETDVCEIKEFTLVAKSV